MRISDWSSDVCSSDLVEDQPQDYIGKAALEALKTAGVDRKLVGIEWPGEELRAELTRSEERRVGKGCVSMWRSRWSPTTQKNKIRTNTESQSMRVGNERTYVTTIST